MKLTKKFSILLISVVFLTEQWGCVSKPISLNEQQRQTLGTIGVVTAQYVPAAELTLPHPSFLQYVGREAAEGAKSGALRGMKEGGVGGGPVHPAFIVFAIIAAPIVGALLGGLFGGLKGAVYGAFTTPDAPQTIQDMEILLKQKLAELRMQETFQDYFVKMGLTSTLHDFVLLENQGPQTPEEHPTYEELVAEGLDTILELRVQSIGLTNGEGGSDPPLTFFMKARARLIKPGEKAVIYDQTFEHYSPARPFSDWVVNQAKPFQKAISHAFLDLSFRIMPTFLLMTESVSLPSEWPSKVKTMPFATDPYLLQPSLQWEVFLPTDIPDLSSEVTDITYDIQIFDVHDQEEPVYVRHELPSIVHTVATPLKPCHTYLWKTRAVFFLGGIPRVTDWTDLQNLEAAPPLSKSCINLNTKSGEAKQDTIGEFIPD